MRRTNKYSICFEPGVPSTFVVSSPFQAMCAINAIHDFEIKDYEFILPLEEDVRNAQLLKLLDAYNVKYRIVYKRNLIERCFVFKGNKNGAQRIFIGHASNMFEMELAFKNCPNNSTIVYLDDGNYTLVLLKSLKKKVGLNKDTIRDICYTALFRTAAFLRNIDYGKYFYTVYNIENEKFKIKYHSLSFFFNKEINANEPKGVYIVGTTIASYCTELQVTLSAFKKQMVNFFGILKQMYPQQSIYYIPHGRCTESFPEKLCNEYGIQFMRVDMCIELYLTDIKNPPLAIYGYASSALANLKLLFPNAGIYNMSFDLEPTTYIRKGYKINDDYYESIGIERIVFSDEGELL